MHTTVASSARVNDPSDPDLPKNMKEEAPMHLTAEEAVEFAGHILATSTGPEAAEALLRSVLRIDPDNARAIEFLGIAMDEQGDNLEAVVLLERAAELQPDNAGTWNNYGNALVNVGEARKAVAAYLRSIEIDPAHAPSRCNLGTVYALGQNFAAAEAELRQALEIDPEHHNAWFNLGRAYFAQGRKKEGIEANLKALALCPRNAYANMLGQAYAHLGDIDGARKVYLDWLAKEPDNPVPAFHLRTFLEEAPDRCNDEYVAAIFDQFAENFEAKLQNLLYRAPEVVHGALKTVRPVADGSLDVLDAGCGTGWCGADLKPYAKRLVGVDLSAGMIDKAKARGVYDEFAVAELTEYLAQHPGAYDHITICDTFCYFGAMTAVAEAAFDALRPDGTLVATFEADEDEGEDVPGYSLMFSGRYKHSGPYIEEAFADAGFEVVGRAKEQLREEFGNPVIGWILTVRKPPQA